MIRRWWEVSRSTRATARSELVRKARRWVVVGAVSTRRGVELRVINASNFPRWVSLIIIPRTTTIIFRASRDVGTPDKVTALTGRVFVVVWGHAYRYRERLRRQMCVHHSHSPPEDGFLHEGSLTRPRPPSLGSGGEIWHKIPFKPHSRQRRCSDPIETCQSSKIWMERTVAPRSSLIPLNLVMPFVGNPDAPPPISTPSPRSSRCIGSGPYAPTNHPCQSILVQFWHFTPVGGPWSLTSWPISYVRHPDIRHNKL